MAGSNKRNGKPTAFQVAALKKAGLTLKGIKTYRDAENALRRLKRGGENKAEKKVKAESQGQQRTVKPSVAKKPVAKKPIAKKACKPVAKKPVAKKPVAKRESGIDFLKRTVNEQVTVKAKPTDRKAITVKGKTPDGKSVTVKGGANGDQQSKKSVAGIGVFRVKVEPYDVIEALMVGFAKSVLAVLGEE